MKHSEDKKWEVWASILHKEEHETESDLSTLPEDKDFYSVKKIFDLKDKVRQALSLRSAELAWIELNRRLPHPKRKFEIFRYVAVFIISLLFSGLAFWMYNNLPAHTDNEICMKTPEGQISNVRLTDGSIVWLNGGSQIKFSTKANRKLREVYLEGEAWFQVKKSDKVPFVVHTSFYDVKVMGTEFNVKAYDSDSEVVTTLEKGAVQIQSSKKLELKKNITLTPGEQLVYNKQKKSIFISQVDPGISSSWKSSELIMRHMRFDKVIKQLEQKYGVFIEVTDTSIFNNHFDGIIKNESIEEVLSILSKTLPIDYQIDEQKIIISKKKKS